MAEKLCEMAKSGAGAKVVSKTETFRTNASGYLYLPKGTYIASIEYNSCVLLARNDIVYTKAYISQTGTIGINSLSPNTDYSVTYYCIE